MLRLFVGIEFPPELKLRLSLLCTGVSGARWVDPGNFHLTLRFIGEITEDAPQLMSKLRPRVERGGFHAFRQGERERTQDSLGASQPKTCEEVGDGDRDCAVVFFLGHGGGFC